MATAIHGDKNSDLIIATQLRVPKNVPIKRGISPGRKFLASRSGVGFGRSSDPVNPGSTGSNFCNPLLARGELKVKRVLRTEGRR